VTPGGHRRFSRTAIDRLIAERPAGMPLSLARLGATSERLRAAYRRQAVGVAGFSASAGLADRVVDDLRDDGRRLVEAIVRYLDAADAPSAAEVEAEATDVVATLARRLADAGVDLADAVPRFVAARAPILDELVRVARRRRLDADRAASIFVTASAILDRLLLAFVAAHRARTRRPGDSNVRRRPRTAG